MTGSESTESHVIRLLRTTTSSLWGILVKTTCYLRKMCWSCSPWNVTAAEASALYN